MHWLGPDVPVFDPNFSYNHNPYTYDDDLFRNDDAQRSLNNAVVAHHHDGTSPLPLGMDWSPPPREWAGRNTVWPRHPPTGWSFCVTLPSWVTVPQPPPSDPVVFFRVQVGIQSPEAITTTRLILRRFSDFVSLFSELKKEFAMKNLPPLPPKKMLRIKSHALLEERRSSLANWIDKLLSDINVSRSASVAIFLELEAAARSSFHEVNEHLDETSANRTTPAQMFQDNSPGSVTAHGSFAASALGNDKHSDQIMDNLTSEHGLINQSETAVDQATYGKDFVNKENSRDKDAIALNLDGTVFTRNFNVHIKNPSLESIGNDLNSLKNTETTTTTLVQDVAHDLIESHDEASRNLDLLLTFPLDERHKLSKILNTQKQRLVTAKADVEDLIARLNQEMAARQYLVTKVKDLEVELETTRLNCQENMQQAVLAEKERFTQMQWDIEELRRKCMETEMKLKLEEDERLLAESTKASVIQEKQMLQQELDVVREQLKNLLKHHDDFEMKSKTDMKVLIKEVKSLRSGELDLKQQLGELIKEKLDLERILQKEKQRMENSHNANTKLLHECAILQKRLRECSVNFLVEEEDKLNIDTSPSDALDLLATSDNRIGLLLAEAQLIAQDVEDAVVAVEETRDTTTDSIVKTYDELRKMLAHMFVDNASLRKQVNSVIRCALNANVNSEEEGEEIHLQKTVLSKFLEK
ncbi:PX domain-containing protein EREX [Vigna radiata var. radiata]|uniref:PX domain-containing protein EREX n=1 Tax=Vigna radiata var. radiata TaxID=3916 RepID=A0A1S3U5P8_VIGRR|nr:PX domain-containing protein EREX [Vigna radiata var. radiata]